MPPIPVRCRACSEWIIWTFSERGERLPVDAEPVGDGVLRIIEHGSGWPEARLVGATADMFDPADFGIRHVPHHATCVVTTDWRAM